MPRDGRSHPNALPLHHRMTGVIPEPSPHRWLLSISGLAPAILETLRSRGGGPPFVKLGRRVVYRREDLDSWLEERVRKSTSDHD